MATDDATECLPDTLASVPRIDVTAADLMIPVDVLLGMLRRQGWWFNVGDRIPPKLVYEALQAELDAGRGWQPVAHQHGTPIL